MEDPHNHSEEAIRPILFVLLHGFAQTPRSWDTVKSLLQERGCYALSLSTLDMVSYQDDSMASALPDVMARTCAAIASLATELSRGGFLPVLVGYSQGGRLVAETLVRHPSLPLYGAVLESAGLGPRTEGERVQFAERNAAWIERLHNEGSLAFIDWWETLPLFERQKLMPPGVQQQIREDRLSLSEAELECMLSSWGPAHQASFDETVQALWAAKDRGVHIEYVVGEYDEKYKEIANELAHERISVCQIAGAGHQVHLENPEAFTCQLVRSFPK